MARKQHQDFAKQQARYQQLHDRVQHDLRQTHDSTAGRLIAKKMHSVKSMGHRFEREATKLLDIPYREEAILVKLPVPIPCLQVNGFGRPRTT